jgi:molecular chaperone DnaJ
MRDFGGLGGFSDLFGTGRGQQSRTGADVKIQISLTLSEVATGVDKTLSLKLLDACDKCNGTGAEPGTQPQRCATCGGSGEVRRAQRSFFGQFVSVAPCPTCGGEGTVVSTPCKKCRGDGRVRAEKTITIRVPAGVATGQYMTLRGRGNAGPRGGEQGDVIVIFQVEDDPRFERDGDDLYSEVLLSYPQLVFGTDLDVPTVTGTVALRVPPSTHSGHVFQIRGKGLPRVNASGTGDLHVRVQLWTPDELTREEETLLRKLAEISAKPPQTRSKGFWTKMKEALGA